MDSSSWLNQWTLYCFLLKCDAVGVEKICQKQSIGLMAVINCSTKSQDIKNLLSLYIKLSL